MLLFNQLWICIGNVDIMNLKKELLTYIIFGILTSIINIGTYLILTDVFHVYYVFSNIFAWILSVFFAYFTNRTWVFESENKNIIKEISRFYSARLFTGVIDTLLMIVFIDVLSLENTFSKLVTAVVIITLNYLFSKVIIFKKV